MDQSLTRFRAAPVLAAASLMVAASVLAAAAPSAASTQRPHTRGVVESERNSQLYAVTVAPKSTDEWALVNNQGPGMTTSSDGVLRHHNGKWRRVKVTGTPNVPTLRINGVAAGSSKQIWLAGDQDGTSDPSPTDPTPVLARSSGGAFKTVKVKGVPTGYLFAAAASSPTNAWVIGVSGAYDADLSLHWNGKRWANVPLSSTAAGVIGSNTVVSTSGPKNAWLVGDGSNNVQVIEHWNGRKWKVMPFPAGSADVNSIATSRANTWIVGDTATTVGDQTVISPLAARWTGVAWKNVKLTHGGHRILESVTAVGSTAYAVGRNTFALEAASTDVPVAARLQGNKGVFHKLKSIGKYTAPQAVAASSGAVMAVGYYETAGYCESPFHSFAEVLVHGTWKQSKIPAHLVPASATGSGLCF